LPTQEIELEYTGELHYVQDKSSTSFKFIGEDCNMVLTTESAAPFFKISKFSGVTVKVIIEIPDNAKEIYSIT
jgi:hypothetical protein